VLLPASAEGYLHGSDTRALKFRYPDHALQVYTFQHIGRNSRASPDSCGFSFFPGEPSKNILVSLLSSPSMYCPLFLKLAGVSEHLLVALKAVGALSPLAPSRRLPIARLPPVRRLFLNRCSPRPSTQPRPRRLHIVAFLKSAATLAPVPDSFFGDIGLSSAQFVRAEIVVSFPLL